MGRDTEVASHLSARQRAALLRHFWKMPPRLGPCNSAFLCCEKILDQSNLRKERFTLAHISRGYSSSWRGRCDLLEWEAGWSHCLGSQEVESKQEVGADKKTKAHS